MSTETEFRTYDQVKGRGRFTTADSEQCRDCGLPVGVWWVASDALYARVTGRQDGSGILCVGCFDIRAAERGLVLRWDASDEIRR